MIIHHLISISYCVMLLLCTAEYVAGEVLEMFFVGSIYVRGAFPSSALCVFWKASYNCPGPACRLGCFVRIRYALLNQGSRIIKGYICK